MRLRLVNAQIAAVFGLEPRDQSEAEALAVFADQGCDQAASRERLREAVAAGAFERIETSVVADSVRKKEQTT